jgi:hypothetical protein
MLQFNDSIFESYPFLVQSIGNPRSREIIKGSRHETEPEDIILI